MQLASLQLVTSFVILGGGAHAQNWPSFRGPPGTGVAADARPPISWNVGSSTDVVWRTAIPGLGH